MQDQIREEARLEALKNYEQHRKLFEEFSPYNHVDANDPPLLMTYPADMTLPSKDAGHGIHPSPALGRRRNHRPKLPASHPGHIPTRVRVPVVLATLPHRLISSVPRWMPCRWGLGT